MFNSISMNENEIDKEVNILSGEEIKAQNYPSLLSGFTTGYADFLPSGWQWFIADSGLTNYLQNRCSSEESLWSAK